MNYKFYDLWTTKKVWITGANLIQITWLLQCWSQRGSNIIFAHARTDQVAVTGQVAALTSSRSSFLTEPGDDLQFSSWKSFENDWSMIHQKSIFQHKQTGPLSMLIQVSVVIRQWCFQNPSDKKGRNALFLMPKFQPLTPPPSLHLFFRNK